MDLKKIAAEAVAEDAELSIAEDFGTSAGNKKGWITKKGAFREIQDKPHKDSLGSLPDMDHLENFTPSKNKSRGEAAVSRALRKKRDVKNAMFTKELGWIDFDWGNVGDPAKNFAGGWGISHIAAKHGDDIKSLAETIAYGECHVLPRLTRPDGTLTARRFCVIKPPFLAILDARGRDGSFCVTEYHKSMSDLDKYRKNPKAEPRILS